MQQAVYVVQSGVVAWEDPEPITDWTAKTVTVCAADGELLAPLVKKVLRGEFIGRRSIFRCHLNPIPSSQNALQRRGLANALRADPPGFVGTVVTLSDAVAVSVAELSRLEDIELAHLSAYRTTCLIATDDVGITKAAIAEVLLKVLLPLNGNAISDVRSKHNTFIVLRVLEEESQSVFQIICDSPTSDSVAKALEEMGVHRAVDRVAASLAIGAIRSGS